MYVNMFAAFGGLGFQSEPMICGGWFKGDAFKSCFSYIDKNWSLSKFNWTFERFELPLNAYEIFMYSTSLQNSMYIQAPPLFRAEPVNTCQSKISKRKGMLTTTTMWGCESLVPTIQFCNS